MYNDIDICKKASNLWSYQLIWAHISNSIHIMYPLKINVDRLQIYEQHYFHMYV